MVLMAMMVHQENQELLVERALQVTLGPQEIQEEKVNIF
jgi:hypothetical protein